MALYGVTIEKETRWHGKQERFNNTYYYEGPALPPDAAGLTAFVNEIANAERPIHGTNVNFVQARVWTAGGTIVQNVTIALVDLAGTGSNIGPPFFREMAIQVEWECDRLNITGKKVYLRKFIRPCCQPETVGATEARGEDMLAPAGRAPFVTYGNRVQTVAVPAGVNWQLRTRGNRYPKANNNAVCNPFVSSREFRRN